MKRPTLSIIIPYYNTEKYIMPLLDTLDKQMRSDVEIIIVDDGSKTPFKTNYKWAKVIRQKNAGPGLARNTGLDAMSGEYFTFIDSDDMVTGNYLKCIFEKIKEGFDYCYLSWKSLPGGWQCSVQLNSIDDEFPAFNLCVWNRVYKTATFGQHRFSPNKLWSEDADYIYRLDERGKKAFIPECIYLYRSNTPNSWTKKMMNGQIDYTRIVYNVPTVTPEIRDDILKEYEHNEIILLTNNNSYPELKKKAMCLPFNTPINGTELRGTPYSGFKRIIKPISTQVVIWTAFTQAIGGIETWIYNFCKYMSKYYDILVLYETINPVQLARLQKIVRCEKAGNRTIVCDTCIVSRITDKVPSIIQAKQTVQMVHACKMMPQWAIPQDHDYIIGVSQAVLDSFNEQNGQVIHNLIDKPTTDRCLFLISATRLDKNSAFEKGHARMLKLADMLTDAGIEYIWLLFSDAGFPEKRKNMIVMPPTMNIAPFLAKADYYVSLSDAEGYGYSMVESLINSTPVITTPISVLAELGFKDNEHGYIVPFDMDFDVLKLLEVPEVQYKQTNTKSIKEWRKILGDTVPKHDYVPEKLKTVKILKEYKDVAIGRLLSQGEKVIMSEERAKLVVDKGYGRIIDG